MKTPDQVIALLKETIDNVAVHNAPFPFGDGPHEMIRDKNGNVVDYQALIYELFNLEYNEVIGVLEEVFRYREDESMGPVLASWLAEDVGVVLDIKVN